jgi:hypothetical protein
MSSSFASADIWRAEARRGPARLMAAFYFEASHAALGPLFLASIASTRAASVFSDRFNHWDRLSNRDFEALAQHYGLPTRLLDWTTSLYVGAFFAFSKVDQCASNFVSIWVLDIDRVQRKFSSEHLEYVTDVYQENVRQLWQMGVFTYNRTPKKRVEQLFSQGSECYDPALDKQLPLLVRFDLPITEVERVLDDLNMMRINSLTLFPGIEGVVRWLEQGGYAFPVESC